MDTRKNFQPGMTVVHEKTGRKGEVVTDHYGVCAPDEVPIRFEGEKAYQGTDWRELCLFNFN